MKLVWTRQATIGWQEVADYIFKEFGEKALLDFIERTRQTEEAIFAMPDAGPIEWDDSDETTTYRFRLINRRSKMLYFIEKNTIYIADFWDVRIPRE